MFTWLVENMSTLIISVILLAVIAGVIASIIRNKKKGKSSCGCGCEQCAMSQSCHGKK